MKCENCSESINDQKNVICLEVDPDFDGETQIYFCDEDCANELVTGITNWKKGVN